MNTLPKTLSLLLLCLSPALSIAAIPQPPATPAAPPAAPATRGPNAARAANAQPAVPLNRAFYTTEMDTLAQQISLTDTQKPKLQDKIDTMNREIDTFLQNAPTQIAAARRGARAGTAGRAGAAARAATLTPAVQGPNPAVLKLQDDLQTLINQHQVLINQDLTPAQRLQWESYKLSRILDQRIVGLSLTDDQRDKLRSLIEATAQELAALTDGKPYATIQGQLFRKVVADVLTDSQISRLFQGALQVQTPNAAARGTRATTPAEAPIQLP